MGEGVGECVRECVSMWRVGKGSVWRAGEGVCEEVCGEWVREGRVGEECAESGKGVHGGWVRECVEVGEVKCGE